MPTPPESFSLGSSASLAIAFDVGTTGITASLLDTATGRRLALRTAPNPQHVHGTDIVTRMAAACLSDEASQGLTKLVREEMARLAGELAEDCGLAEIPRRSAVAANPAMEHFILGLPVRSIAFPPCKPLFRKGQQVTGTSLNWPFAAELFLFPLPGGYVGGDLVAFLYGEMFPGPRSRIPGPRLYLDIGTNTEIVLTDGDRLFATSAASGPAFEGGNLSCGIAAQSGAITGVTLEGDRLLFATVDNVPPVGLCGSAVIDLLAVLLRTGIVDTTGRLLSPDEITSNLGTRVVQREGTLAFVIYRDARQELLLTQEDIRQLQLAKAAIRAGMEVLFERSGSERDRLEEVVVTGSFGAELSPVSLKSVGVFTEKMVSTSTFRCEGALAGVERALCRANGFAEVDALAVAISVIPLSGTPAFEKHFMDQISFKE
jgi:uncharacterized 2Fe-2S/4Fe-4S cluster protein (DUF4445 family)